MQKLKKTKLRKMKRKSGGLKEKLRFFGLKRNALRFFTLQ